MCIRRFAPSEKSFIAEASRALARLDAERLEEMALSCEALTRDLPSSSSERRAVFKFDSEDTLNEMAVFARVIEATRANLKVLGRPGSGGSKAIEYKTDPDKQWILAGNRNGDN
jgi:hypothetical protein